MVGVVRKGEVDGAVISDPSNPIVVNLAVANSVRLALAEMVIDPCESIAVCLGSVLERESATEITAREMTVGNDGCTFRDLHQAMPDPRFLLSCIKRAAASSMSFVMVHTHPGLDSVTLSPKDITAARAILDVAQRRIPHCPHAFIVIGHDSAFGVAIWHGRIVRVEVRF